MHEGKCRVKDLDSYLNDHLAGSVAALELIAHCAHLCKGIPLGAFFSEMEAQIATDQDTLRDLMTRLSIEESKVLQAGAWAGEKLGRALLAMAGNEPGGLGLLLALEGLIMGIVGKGLLWRALAAANLPKLETFDFEKLRRRAAEQIKRAPSRAGTIRAASARGRRALARGQLGDLKSRDETQNLSFPKIDFAVSIEES